MSWRGNDKWVWKMETQELRVYRKNLETGGLTPYFRTLPIGQQRIAVVPASSDYINPVIPVELTDSIVSEPSTSGSFRLVRIAHSRRYRQGV